MPRIRKGAARRRAKNRVLKEARGYRGARGSRYRLAKEATRRAKVNAYIDRRKRKRDFRKLWITRINAACRARGLSYSRFIAALNKLNIEIDRSMLSNMAIEDPGGFDHLVNMAKDS
jgi:large subunit ribosomal protein L20